MNIDLSKLHPVTVASIYVDLSRQDERNSQQLLDIITDLDRRVGVIAANEMVQAMLDSVEPNDMEWMVANE